MHFLCFSFSHHTLLFPKLAAATIYCMGIELLTTKVEGVDLSEMNKYRWDGSYEGVRLADLPHKQLTAPVKVLEHFFDTEKRPRNR